MNSPINRLEEVFKSIVDHAGAKLVYGDPVSEGPRTILPVAKVRYGFGSGSGGSRSGEYHGGGGGGGLVATPVGVFEITAAQTRFIPITTHWTLIAAVALGVVVGWLAVPKHEPGKRD